MRVRRRFQEDDEREVPAHMVPRPYRAPTHELAIGHRNGSAILGITHAGEVLAGVRLDRDRLLRHLGDVARVARALGLGDQEIEDALGIPARLSDTHERTKRATVRTCIDCEAEIPPGLGRPPLRCGACAEQHRANQPVKHRATKPQPDPLPVPVCIDCAKELPNRRRQRCGSCTATHKRRQSREYQRAYYGATHGPAPDPAGD